MFVLCVGKSYEGIMYLAKI